MIISAPGEELTRGHQDEKATPACGYVLPAFQHSRHGSSYTVSVTLTWAKQQKMSFLGTREQARKVLTADGSDDLERNIMDFAWAPDVLTRLSQLAVSTDSPAISVAVGEHSDDMAHAYRELHDFSVLRREVFDQLWRWCRRPAFSQTELTLRSRTTDDHAAIRSEDRRVPCRRAQFDVEILMRAAG